MTRYSTKFMNNIAGMERCNGGKGKGKRWAKRTANRKDRRKLNKISA